MGVGTKIMDYLWAFEYDAQGHQCGTQEPTEMVVVPIQQIFTDRLIGTSQQFRIGTLMPSLDSADKRTQMLIMFFSIHCYL